MSFSAPNLKQINNDTVGIKNTFLFVPLIILLAFTVSGYASIDSAANNSKTRQVSLAGLAATQPVLIGTSDLVSINVNDAVPFIVANVSLHDQATPIDITSHPFSINFRRQTEQLSGLGHDYQFVGSHDRDQMLEAGENLQIQVFIEQALIDELSPDDEYALDIKPQTGPILTLYKKTND